MRGQTVPLRVGLVGCGYISAVYLETLSGARNVRVTTCADLVADIARSCARRHSLSELTIEELLADPSVDVVLNLTPPLAHADVSDAALAAGKHVYTEKPLACTFAQGRRLTELAAARGLRMGSAPDTFLGPGWQSARAVVDSGRIGEPVAVEATMLHRGHEGWHPNPDFFYQPGGGPMLDMGPYYVTALVSLLGPVRRVTASAKRAFDVRPSVPGPSQGRRVPVDVATHVAAVLDFANGAVATLVTSFDVYSERESRVVLYGTEGTLELPDPNGFEGRLDVWSPTGTWTEIPLERAPIARVERGIGLVDMARALESGRPHRASDALALHVLEVIEATVRASETGEHQPISTTCARPEPVEAEPDESA